MLKKVVIFGLSVYIVSALASYGVFAMLGTPSNKSQTESEIPQEEETESTLLSISPDEPKDQPCPLSGKMFTQTERDAWSQRRPLAVMIENHPDARPQSGLASADVVFEMMAEGGVTRFMGLYYCDAQRADVTLAPIRSARTYFIDYASGFNLPMYVHVGGANIDGPTDALGQLGDYGWKLENDIDQFSVGYPTFVRNSNRLGRDVATEHTMESSTELLWEVAAERGWTNMSPELRVGRTTKAAADWAEGFTGWTYADEVAGGDPAETVEYEFWDGYSDYGVRWTYDAATQMYNRNMAGEPHIDLNTEKQIKSKNVIVILTEEKGPLNEKKHMLYQTTGTGDALIFTNGTVQEVTWKKATRESELEFVTAKGQPVELGRGHTWISVVDVTTDVAY